MKNILVFVHSRANYGRIKSFFLEAQHSKEINVSAVVGSSAVLDKYGNVSQIMKEDGVDVVAKLTSCVQGDENVAMAISTGLAIVETSTILDQIKPDAVLTVADRYETLATAVSASYMNIPVIHTQGGDITGSIDESVRHAITRLSHIHFPASRLSAERLKKMGEDPDYIFNVGCPGMDLIRLIDKVNLNKRFAQYAGVGSYIDFDKPYIVILHHPVTTSFDCTSKEINSLVKVAHNLKDFGYQILWFWPNIDSGSESISKTLRRERESGLLSHVHFYKNFSPEDYIALLSSASLLIGNSSSGLREASYLGLPVVNIGDRQSNRECASNVMHTTSSYISIIDAVRHQLSVKSYPSSDYLGDGYAGKKMVDILSQITLPSSQKTLHL